MSFYLLFEQSQPAAPPLSPFDRYDLRQAARPKTAPDLAKPPQP